MYRYRSYMDMSLAVWRAIPNIGRTFDLVVGVPRSGIVPAAMLAQWLDCRLASLDLFLMGKMGANGSVRFKHSETETLEGIHSVLIVDDSLSSGGTMSLIRKRIGDVGIAEKYGLEIRYAAVFVQPGEENQVDYAFEICEQPRLFQWNILNHPRFPDFCLDIDGVVCRDPTENENDDGAVYRQFIKQVPARFRAHYEIGAFVSSRLEKYRSLTEEWLRRHGFKFRALHLLNLKTKEERLRLGCHASFKADVYSRLPQNLFIESDLRQAEEIHRRTGKDVFCTEDMSFWPRASSAWQMEKRMLCDRIAQLENSRSYRIGRMLTSPWRLAKRVSEVFRG